MDLHLARLTSAALALAGFIVAIVSGLSAGNRAEDILVRALVSMTLCAVAGYAVGLVYGHVVRIETRKIDAATEAALAAEMESSATIVPESLESARRLSDSGESGAGGGAVSTGRAQS